MRALCSVRGPLGGDTRALGAGARILSLRMPGQLQPLHFVVEAKSRVKELKTLANAHAQLQGMTDTDLFGLAILQNGEYLFVDLESKLSKYAPKSWRSSHTHGLDANGKPLLELHLVVQFHVESPLLLHDDVGRRLYFLQLRHNVRTRDVLPPEVVLLLTGLALQAEYGDADAYEDRDYFKVEEYAPTSLTGDWVATAMRACHREHRGLSRSDAETRYIREVCLLPDTINSHRYRLKPSKSEPEPGTVWLLVTAKGIKILPDNGHLSNFIWSSIGKLSFDRKKFEIRTEDGKITLFSSSEEKCKYLFALCKETHQFSMKIAPKLNEILRKEEDERKVCFGYSKSFNLQCNQNKSEQRISVISSTSSNTTSGIVSDRVQSEDELEIMIDSPPAPSTESLAFAHLLDSSNSYFIRHIAHDNQPLSKSSSLQHQKSKVKVKKNKEDTEKTVRNDIPISETSQHSTNQIEDTVSLPDKSGIETLTDSPNSSKLKCTGSQCSSSCSTVIMARGGLSALSRASNASSLELGYSHTAQNSMISDNSIVGIDVEYTQDTASALYDGLGQPVTVAASSETSGVYTMSSSELTARSKIDVLSQDSRTDYQSSHYDCYKPSKENDLADFDTVSSILKNKLERTSHSTVRLQIPLISSDCVDGVNNFSSQEHDNKENIMFRERTNSNVSAASFHGDGSDPTDNKHNLLTASELSDLIVGRGVYPKSQSVSDTLDSVSDYVRLPLQFSGDSYLPGHEDTAPSDDHYPNNPFFDRPPTPPTRIDSRKLLNLSLPNILDIDVPTVLRPPFPSKPPPPYEYNHKTISSQTNNPLRAPPAYPGIASSSMSLQRISDKEEVAARMVTSKPMITILKAEAGDVNASSERTFASPMVLEHRFQKSKRHQASSRRAERSKLAQGISHNLSPSREIPPHSIDSNVLVAMMKLPPPPPPPRRTRLPPPPPVTRMPPPPPPHNPMFHQQLYSDVDYVYYPIQDPAISQQNYLDHKLTEARISNMHKTSLQYRSTPYLSTSMSASSVYGSIQNLSDSYIQLPGTRASWYSLTSRTSLSNHSINLDRPPMSSRIPEIPHFSKTKSDQNILNCKDPPPIKMRRMPPPPPPPYEHKKKLPSPLKEMKISHSSTNINSEVSVSRAKGSNCDLDIKTLREKSKNLDLPLIAALCNDRSLLKQTKAFGTPKLFKQTGSDCENERKCVKSVSNTTENVDVKNKQESNVRRVTTGSQKKILIRNPTDKLPALPVSEAHTPRALSNTYVTHPAVVKNKKTQPSS